MKQFSLEEYLKKPSRKVVTKDGDSVRIICTDLYGEKPIITKIEGCEYSYPFYEDGRFLSYGEPSHLDLFFAPEIHEGWVNVYQEDNLLRCGNVYDTKSEAEQHGSYVKRLATSKIEWEE